MNSFALKALPRYVLSPCLQNQSINCNVELRSFHMLLSMLQVSWGASEEKALGAFWVRSEKLLILPKLTFGLFDLSSFFLLAVPLPFVAACNRLSPPIFVRIRRFQRIGLETYRRILFWQSWEPPRRDARPLCCTSSLPALMCASSQPRRARLFETGKAMASFVLSGNERIRLLLL